MQSPQQVSHRNPYGTWINALRKKGTKHPGEGMLTQKMHTPASKAQRNPYNQGHKISNKQSFTLSEIFFKFAIHYKCVTWTRVFFLNVPHSFPYQRHSFCTCSFLMSKGNIIFSLWVSIHEGWLSTFSTLPYGCKRIRSL